MMEDVPKGEHRMGSPILHNLIDRLRCRTASSSEGGLSDAQLLERFVATRDEAAFEVLVWRHGALVVGVCRRLLHCEQDVEDAFQATFLTLVRKAAAVGKREALASWLYKVASRIALAARAQSVRTVCPSSGFEPVVAPDEDVVWRDLRPVLDEEVNRLPEKYRAAFVLCYLQGKSTEEAAGLLHCPRGTVLSRLARARERLRSRLERRGVGTLALAALNPGEIQAAEPPVVLVQRALEALHHVTGSPAVGVVSPQAAALCQGVLRAMNLKKLAVAALLFAGLGFAGVGAYVLASGRVDPVVIEEPRSGDPPAQPPKNADKDPGPEDPLMLAALRRKSQENLKQIAIALHCYHDTYGHLPQPALYSKDGKPLLSWRVAILPWIEQDHLYKQFKLDEPWDSEHNKKLIAQMPKLYAPVRGKTDVAGGTFYQAIVGKDAAFEPGKKLRLVDFVDGTSNTILVVEAGSAVPWTKPEDLPFVADQALPKFGGLFDGHFHALTADGAVILISRKFDEKLLRLAITRNDGTPFDWGKLSVSPPGLGAEKVSPADLPRLNAKLKAAVEETQKEIEKTREELKLLVLKIEHGLPEIDARTAELLKENAELQKTLDRALEELEKLRADRARLEQILKDRPRK
jgi:RNA polymerase sigma factor (sigma-70 family)